MKKTSVLNTEFIGIRLSTQFSIYLTCLLWEFLTQCFFVWPFTMDSVCTYKFINVKMSFMFEYVIRRVSESATILR